MPEHFWYTPHPPLRDKYKLHINYGLYSAGFEIFTLITCYLIINIYLM